MLFFADLHLHSHYSRAVSEKMSLEGLAAAARVKGLRILGTGDFSHPSWFSELKTKLTPSDFEGFYVLKSEASEKERGATLFLITNEVATIHSTPRGVKKVHHVVHAPSLEAAAQINDVYARLGSLSADGRPTFGETSCAAFAELTFEACREAVIVPAHAWTPWFGVFGSQSGFDSLDEAYEDQAKKIFAIETGMSSDPAMNWRLSALDRVALLSNSDSHSPYPWRLGRECNAFEFEEKELSYANLFKAVREKNEKHFRFTVEVDPAYGKYHWDGHRTCGFSSPPSETRKLKGICPVCRRPLTIGVENRVEQLADRPAGFKPPHAIPFRTVLPLHELLAAVYASTLASRRVNEVGSRLIAECGSELAVLLDAPPEKLRRAADEKIVALVLANREGALRVRPGFDGEYGVLQLTAREREEGVKAARKQRTLDDYGLIE
ncbi:MAG: endonuclease Q family protein [Candidatus Norongarragalinales archaeon]